MIVDDDPDATLRLKMVLCENSFTVDSFNDPILALKYFQPGLYELLVIDIQMPQMNKRIKISAYQKVEE